jgi:hypothetical protein
MTTNKDTRKKINGERRVIAEHRAKIDEELRKPIPDWQGIEKWRKDIARHERILARLEKKLPPSRRKRG